MSTADEVRSILSKACEKFEEDQDEAALRLHREALCTAMSAFQRSQEGEVLHLALVAYRGIAVCALETGRNSEAAIAIETGLANAEVGLRHWPNAPPLLEEYSSLSLLKEGTGLQGAVYVTDDFGQWVSDD